jgi:arylsulfatase A
MNRREFLKLGAAAFAAPTILKAAEGKKPNIVLIMADDMGYECMSANGSVTCKTPRLDALAAEGIRFENCHSQPICTPTRVQIMTGIYNNRNYIRFGLLDPKATTFAHLLKKAGYATCIAGKWQLANGLDGPKHFGFDEYCLWQCSRRPSRYANPGLEINGELKDYTNGEYGPDIVSDYLCDFIERHKDGPFLAYYPMILPHWPFEPPPDHPDYDPTKKSSDRNRQSKYFFAMVGYVDKIVGKIADKLKALGIERDTLLIFTGDNGTAVGVTTKTRDGDVPGGKGRTTDNGTHVPGVAWWPGTTPAGKVSRALIDFSDVLPTMAELAGAEVPKELDIDGHSFAPLLQGKPFKAREWIYCWYERNGNRPRAREYTHNGRHKLYADGRFYDMKTDFAEQKPLDVNALPADVKPVYAMLKAALDEKVAVTKKVNATWTPLKPAKKKGKGKKKQ